MVLFFGILLPKRSDIVLFGCMANPFGPRILTAFRLACWCLPLTYSESILAEQSCLPSGFMIL